MLSDVDWNVLLSGPSMVNNTQNNSTFDFNFDILSPQPNKI